MGKTPSFERTLRSYKAAYELTDDFFLGVLGIKSRATWLKLRRGKSEFTVRQLHDLSKALGMGMDELYEQLPDINHGDM